MWAAARPTVGPALLALLAVADRRALPALQWILEQPGPHPDLRGTGIHRLGPLAADLVPVIRQRLRDLTTDGDDGRGRADLVTALGWIGPPAAAAVPDLLALPVDPGIVSALGAMGPAAGDAAETVRTHLGSDDPVVAVAAAHAYWRITADSGPALPVLVHHLDGSGNNGTALATLAALAELGPVAAPVADRLQGMLRTGTGWVRKVRVARTLWATTDDPQHVLPVLHAAWDGEPHSRPAVAEVVARMGVQATGFAPLLNAELRRTRRHNADDGGWSSSQVEDDLAFVASCTEALAAMGGADPDAVAT
jgi:hypothetical protein